jgi:16S rRNA (guanine966-N2)-methyltransferase
MRVIAGRLRGRALHAPSSRDIRPTSDRLRESIFDILVHGLGVELEGARVIDLFAGTGALGVEALSRGAAFAMFVDDGAEARALIRANVETLGLGGVTRIFRADATRLGKAPAGPRFQLAFLDPPYGLDRAGPALAALAKGGWLDDGAICVIEESAKAAVALPPGFKLIERRAYGETAIAFAQAGSAGDAG